MGAPVLTAEGLRLVRGGRAVLEEVRLRLPPGAVHVVIGPNGAGKSTLLLALAGLLAPARGEVRLGDASVHAMPDAGRARRIAWRGTLAETDLGLTLADRLELARAGRAGLSVEEAAARLGLAGRLGMPLARLSAGERARAELASLFVQDAPVWLLDEPTAHLDAAWAGRLLAMLRAQARRGRVVVAVLHDLAEAQAVADGVVLVGGGGAALRAPGEAWRKETLEALYGVSFARWTRGARTLWLPDREAAASLPAHHEREGDRT